MISITIANAICLTIFFSPAKKKFRWWKFKFRRRKVHFYYIKSIFRWQNFSFRQRIFFFASEKEIRRADGIGKKYIHTYIHTYCICIWEQSNFWLRWFFGLCLWSPRSKMALSKKVVLIKSQIFMHINHMKEFLKSVRTVALISNGTVLMQVSPPLFTHFSQTIL